MVNAATAAIELDDFPHFVISVTSEFDHGKSLRIDAPANNIDQVLMMGKHNYLSAFRRLRQRPEDAAGTLIVRSHS